MDRTSKYDFLIVGGGVFGCSTAIELAKRKYKVGLLNPGTIPHHLAASTDITKVVRREYGTDEEYFQMGDISIQKWHEWNDLFGEEVYCEVGLLSLCRNSLHDSSQIFELSSYERLKAHGFSPEHLVGDDLKKRFPVLNTAYFTEASFNQNAGYVKSGRAIEFMASYAKSLGVDILQGCTVKELVKEGFHLTGVRTLEGVDYQCGHLIVSAGAHTPYLVPELQPYMKVTGHPVFWLKPKYSKDLVPPSLSVFTADISNTGWYGFPYLEDTGVLKVAKHSNGLIVHPDNDDRQVTEQEIIEMRSFVKEAFPSIAEAPLVYTRRCLYNDTLDGHFWIDNHPELQGLSVSAGGSGHAMKMGPILGEMTADVAEGKSHQFSERYSWRHLDDTTVQVEEARMVLDRKL